MKKLSLTVGWLYPDLMNTYGDRGNIIVLKKRAEWRGIKVNVEHISLDTKYSMLNACDLLFMGGAQDTQQEIVSRDLRDKKGSILVKMIEDEVPGLYICGAYQFMGRYYRTSQNKKILGLGVFPLYTENPGEKATRLIGDIVVKPRFVVKPRLNLIYAQTRLNLKHLEQPLVGFENHGGRTYLDDVSLALGTVIKGFGNNGKDKTEGIVYKNSFGTYLHGPILPKNPQLADLLLLLALEVKYNQKFHLEPLEDSIEQEARNTILKRLGCL